MSSAVREPGVCGHTVCVVLHRGGGAQGLKEPPICLQL